jgi:hypothetical protein
MKYILALEDNEYKTRDIELEIFNNKEEMFKYLTDNNWKLLEPFYGPIDWDEVEKRTDKVVRYSVIKEHTRGIGRIGHIYLRIMK